jgi:hypothetical protein
MGPIDSVSAWASGQPVWAQVVIGLTLFFVIIPIILVILFYILRIAVPVLIEAVEIFKGTLPFLFGFLLVVAIGFAIWYASSKAGTYISYEIVQLLLLSPAKFFILRNILSIALFALSIIFTIFFSIRYIPFIRRTVAEWKTGMGLPPQDET